MKTVIYTAILSASIILSGCNGKMSTLTGSDSSGSVSTNFVVKSATLSATDRGVVITSGSASAMGFGISSQSASENGDMKRVKHDHNVEDVKFEVEDKDTHEKKTQSVKVKKTKKLSSKYTAVKFENDAKTGREHNGIINTKTGEVIDIGSSSVEEVQATDDDIYTLDTTTHGINRVSLLDPAQTVHQVSDPTSVTSNTSFTAVAYSSLGSSPGPFRFIPNFAKPVDSSFSPTLLITQGSSVLAFGGPGGGGSRVMLYKEGEQAFDCGGLTVLDNGNLVSGGVIQTADKSLYHIKIWQNQYGGVYGVTQTFGTQLVKLDIRRQTFYDGSEVCASYATDPVVVTLGTYSHFEEDGTNTINHRTNYSIDTIERFVPARHGFLHTYDDGSGGVTMDWTDLDLTDVPSGGVSTFVQLDGDTLYYVTGGVLYSRQLVSGSSIVTYYNGGLAIDSFDVVGGQVVFSSGGSSYSVSSAGATATLVGAAVIGSTGF
jgi:hypothetical protein